VRFLSALNNLPGFAAWTENPRVGGSIPTLLDGEKVKVSAKASLSSFSKIALRSVTGTLPRISATALVSMTEISDTR
jgi:hypothetical protein